MVRQPLGARAVLVCGPDVAEITEGDLAFRVRRRAKQLRLTLRERRQKQQSSGQKRFRNHSNLQGFLALMLSQGRPDRAKSPELDTRLVWRAPRPSPPPSLKQ